MKLLCKSHTKDDERKRKIYILGLLFGSIFEVVGWVGGWKLGLYVFGILYRDDDGVESE